MNFALVAQTPSASPDTSELPDIQDIIQPEALPNYILIIVFIVGGLIFLAAVIGLIIYFVRKNQSSTSQIPAGRAALKKLDDLEANADSLPANVFSLQVSDILKIYLKDRFRDSFRYETSEEFIHRLSTRPSNTIPQSLQNDLANFVGLCDELKFARPANADTNKLPLLEEARGIIREPITINASPAVS